MTWTFSSIVRGIREFLFHPAPKNWHWKPMKTVAICVGHSRIGDRGAESVGGVSEWVYNSGVARALAAELERRGMRALILSHYPRKTYGAAIGWLAGHLRERGADVAVELHFNSTDSDARGYEYLYCHPSKTGRRLAEHFLHSHSKAFPEGVERGAKAVERDGRGGNFLWRTHCPAVIAEPFFGSSPSEWERFANAEKELAKAYADALESFFDT